MYWHRALYQQIVEPTCTCMLLEYYGLYMRMCGDMKRQKEMWRVDRLFIGTSRIILDKRLRPIQLITMNTYSSQVFGNKLEMESESESESESFISVIGHGPKIQTYGIVISAHQNMKNMTRTSLICCSRLSWTWFGPHAYNDYLVVI